jgi:GNAT superfamily N-acetyltransferase
MNRKQSSIADAKYAKKAEGILGSSHAGMVCIVTATMRKTEEHPLTMGAEYTIRMATLADVALISHQRANMFIDMGMDPAPIRQMEQPFQMWVSDLMTKGAYYGWFAVADDGQVVAGAGLWLNPWIPSPQSPSGQRGYILNVYTEPEHRRQGLARRLVQTCIDDCRERGLSAVVLHASDQGRPIYERMGFKVTNEMRLYV